MAGGDFVVRSNTTSTTGIASAGNRLTLNYNNAVDSEGSGITYSSGTFTLGETGRFLVLANAHFDGDPGNNDRLNFKLVFELGGTELVDGYATGYTRQVDGGNYTFNDNWRGEPV